MILVDSSIWIAFFKGKEEGLLLSGLLEENRVCVNSLILSELIPSLNHRKEYPLADRMKALPYLELQLDWDHIMAMQTKNLANGLNRIGIPDLIIAQNSLQNKTPIYSLDNHFSLMRELHGLKLYP